MKVSEQWLREWVNPTLTREKLCAKLTMSGLEVEAQTPVEENVDYVIDVAVTPNRGDCLSILGLAKEIAALTQCKITMPRFLNIKPLIANKLAITVKASAECAHYVGRIIRNVKTNSFTPRWLQERINRSGINCIHPIVDVMNYVMLELGQPMHAFNLRHIVDGIQVRKAKTSEEITLLDNQTVKLHEDTLIIADQQKPLAIAGVMGGLDSAVTVHTEDIFLESAYFTPASIAHAGRQFGISSESSYRFERGIDPTLQTIAIEHATRLLLEIVGGEPGPVVEFIDKKQLPQPINIVLRETQIEKILGINVPAHEIKDSLQRLEFSCKKITIQSARLAVRSAPQKKQLKKAWQVTVPARRSDITLEIDLIEEIIRLYGYEKLPQRFSTAPLHIHPVPENKISLSTLRRVLCDLGYHEAITYSFIDKKQQAIFDPQQTPKELLNPITADMAVMRTTLWPGLAHTLLYNFHRQQTRIRLFEIGLRYITHGTTLLQQKVVSGLVSGTAFAEQWGVPTRAVDFFDIKGDVEQLFKLTLEESAFIFKPGTHPALHPGQTAIIERAGKYVGRMGALHPHVLQTLDIPSKVFVFELLLEQLKKANVPQAEEISKFPEIRRDIAIWVDQQVSSQLIRDAIEEVAGELLKETVIFDVYQGKGAPPNHKSIALGLTLQHSSRTLIDQEVAELIERVIVILKQRFAAELRG